MSRLAMVAHADYPGDPRLRRQADALTRAGHEIDLFVLRAGGEEADELIGSVRVVRLPVRRAFGGLAGHLAEYVAFAGIAAIRLAREHRRRRYRLVQVATVPDFLAFAAAPLRLSGVPLLLDLHEDMPEFYRDRFGSGARSALLPLVAGAARASAAVADELITVHEPLRQLSIARGVSPDKISVVMNSADPRLFDPSRHPRRAFMEDGELRLIHHSSLQRIYGGEVLVEAVARIGDALRLRLDIYGDGPHRGALEAAVSRTGTADRVRINGPVPMDDLPALIAAADIGLVPTLPEPYLQYSLSTKLLELAAMATPVIASDLATFRAHFTEDAIRFVPGGDPNALASAMVSLAEDPAASAALGSEARRQVAAYGWDEQAARYVAIVERLMAR
ncbi:MAG: glycosyltransferase family 4 protein [Chloroflexota bacterium]|nr:glycosyltransferase family 4 protein [Chloroflexota bacterium]